MSSENRPSLRTAFRDFLNLHDVLGLAIYGLLGLALLGFILHEVGKAIWDTGSVPLIAVFLGTLLLTAATVLRDFRRKRFSWVTKAVLGAWGLAVALIVILELVEGFRR